MGKSEIRRIQDHRTKIWNQYYLFWRDNPVRCPYLNDLILATQIGWRHISGLSKKRTLDDIHRRLNSFIYARDIVEKSGTCQYIRRQNGETYYTFEAVVKFKEDGEKGLILKKIKVVVKTRKDGSIAFHSVM